MYQTLIIVRGKKGYRAVQGIFTSFGFVPYDYAGGALAPLVSPGLFVSTQNAPHTGADVADSATFHVRRIAFAKHAKPRVLFASFCALTATKATMHALLRAVTF